jgi:hypothetical protein
VGSPLVVGYVLSSVLSVALAAAAWRWPRGGRLPYAVLFGGASVLNAVTALRTPMVYVEGFGPRAVGPMKEIIEGAVALAPDAFVLAIAVGQAAIAAGLAVGRGAALVLGVAGAATFLVAISWLGVGAAFPTNLVLAAGVLLLLRGRR